MSNLGVNQLNFFERAWVDWYKYIRNDSLATGIFFFTMHETVYFSRCLIWLLMEKIPYFRKWKIQDQKLPSAQDQWECTKYVIVTHFSIELPTIYFFHPLMQRVGLSTTVPFPSLYTIAWQIAIFFVLEDTWHYFIHRLLHHQYLYKHIHKTHHRFSAPFGMAAAFAHPLEIAILGFGTVGSPILLSCLTRGNMHIVTVYVWVTLRLLQAVDAHSGYDFPWSLQNWVPLWGGAAWHDKHHELFFGNYASSFRWWDIVMNTRAVSVRGRDEQEKNGGVNI